MIDSITHFPLRRALFGGFVLFVFCVSSYEIIIEFAAEETLQEMADDLLRLVFSAVLLAILIFERFAQSRELADLRGQLTQARGKLAKIDSQSVKLASQYRAVMQKQFDAWRLSISEQDVVLGMLNGRSFRHNHMLTSGLLVTFENCLILPTTPIILVCLKIIGEAWLGGGVFGVLSQFMHPHKGLLSLFCFCFLALSEALFFF